MNNVGALSDKVIADLFKSGFISGIGEENIRPGSLDLPIGPEILRIQGEFLPRPGESVREFLMSGDIETTPHDYAMPLEVGVCYLAKIEGHISFPSTVYGYANPKSSTGRNFVTAKVVADGISMYDSLGVRGFKGGVHVLIRPDSYPVRVAPGLALSQLRLLNQYTVLDKLALEIATKERAVVFQNDGQGLPYSLMMVDEDGSFFVTLDLGRGSDLQQIGWEAIDSRRILDLTKPRSAKVEDFFRPVYASGGMVYLRKGRRYILSTAEYISVSPFYAAELRPIDVRLGEFRTHAAGFIDPGWGYGREGEVYGRPITLEVVAYEDMIIRLGQPVGKVRLEKMQYPPELPYDSVGSNYIKQNVALLAKQFIV